jgi:hypothetical protein
MCDRGRYEYKARPDLVLLPFYRLYVGVAHPYKHVFNKRAEGHKEDRDAMSIALLLGLIVEYSCSYGKQRLTTLSRIVVMEE